MIWYSSMNQEKIRFDFQIIQTGDRFPVADILSHLNFSVYSFIVLLWCVSSKNAFLND